MRELSIEGKEELNQDQAPTKTAKAIKQKAKSEGLKNLGLKSTWEEKPLHGHYPLRVNKVDVDQRKTHHWLRSSGVKAENQGLILASQDQCLLTRNYQVKVIMNGADPRCRICAQYDETIRHLI